MNGSGKTLTRVRVARAFQQRCCFFAVTSVTVREKMDKKTAENSVKRMKKNALFDTFFTELRPTRIVLLLMFVRCVLQSIENQ